MSSSTPSTSSSPSRPQVKKENEEEIKEFAETAMNELLGWYGYERLELRRWAASRAKDASSPEQNNENKDKDECSWCNKSIAGSNAALQHASATFCSELCFSQSRRANFKRAKTCDWCRHVRHTVAYVDFQDGATQLQFCSDKCLNQYKMHIFCRETQAHLDLNPHLVNASSSSNLITPDLWLKNCKSRSTSPTSERSVSPENLNKSEKAEKPRKSPLPLITVAPPSKLMKAKGSPEESAQKSPETKKDLRNKANLRKRRTSKCSATVTSQSLRQQQTPKAQDLRMCSPIDRSSSSSTLTNSALHSPAHPINPPNMPPPFPNPLFGMPAPVFVDNIPHGMNDPRLPMFRPNFLPRPGIPLPERPRFTLPLNYPPGNGPPPVTILVPYPVILPIPLPIPVPLPMNAFIQAHLSNNIKTENRNDDNEGPLDFTINSDKKNKESTPEPTESDKLPEELADKESVPNGSQNSEQTVPKFKITRLGNKISKIVTKPKDQESTRPLRKRRRLVEVSVDEDTLISKTRKTVEV